MNRQTSHISKTGLKYLLYLPKGYDKKNKHPLMLFLHGAGEKGNDLELVKRNGPPKLIEEGKDFPFLIVSPQCPRSLYWMPNQLNELINEVVYSYNADENRIYITGISMGGYGTWALALTYPDEFAAAIPICGGGDSSLAFRIKDLPLWVFHGAQDDIVPLSESEEMVEALKKAKSNVKFTVYPNANHDSWTSTYDNPEIYEWLLKQKRKNHKERNF